MNKINRGSLWLGKEWKEAIELSLNTPDCGVEPVYRDKHPFRVFDNTKVFIGYQLFGWGNGYRRKYITRIPKKYNSYVRDRLNVKIEKNDYERHKREVLQEVFNFDRYITGTTWDIKKIRL